jgi:Zn-dependent protease
MITGVDATAPAQVTCSACATAIAPGLLSCPACHGLVHATELRALAARAAQSAEAGDAGAELAAWRASLELLPPQSRQFTIISAKVAALSHAADTVRPDSAPVPKTGLWKWLAPLGPAVLILWKFKFLVVALATKGKLLFLGLTKSTTLLTMFLSLGVYWAAWGLWFAFGFVLSIYVHEMGHVAALRRYGIAATAPMFIPGLGAVVRARQSLASARETARVGLAGPWWGLGAAVASYGIGLAGGGDLFLAIARIGAWVNLFNLLPVWQLDGNRGFAALTRPHRWIAVAALTAAWTIAGDGLLILLILAAIVRAMAADAPKQSDTGALWRYSAVTVALAIIFRVAEPLAVR